MFENIIGHQTLLQHLRILLQDGKFPQSTMLEGATYSGKFTIAMEIARLITCKQVASSHDCSCDSCRHLRNGQNFDLIVLGRRNFRSEIVLCHGLATADPSCADLLQQALRKLMLRFDSRIWEDRQVSKLGTLIEDIEQDLMELHRKGRVASKLLQRAQGLISCLPSELIPISAVRNSINHAHSASSSSPLVFIIENIDDIHLASSNAMLKIIEEPPPNVYFILTAVHASSLVESLRSRLMLFRLDQRSPEEEQRLLAEVFHTEHSSLRQLIYAHAFQSSPRDCGILLARSLLGEAGYEDFRLCLNAIKDINSKEFFSACMYELSEYLRSLLRGLNFSQLQAHNKLWEGLRSCIHQVNIMNIRPEHALEALFFTSQRH